MIRENPIRFPEWTNASVTEPDWAMPGHAAAWQVGRDVADVRGAVGDVRSMTPMQFGPTSARPCSRAIRATSTCIAAAASPPSTTPPPGMITAGTPAAAAASVTDAARNGLSATIAMSGPLGERVQRRDSRAARSSSSYFGLTKWQRVALPITRRLSRTVSAIHDARRRPDDRDAARREQRPQVDDARRAARSSVSVIRRPGRRRASRAPGR